MKKLNARKFMAIAFLVVAFLVAIVSILPGRVSRATGIVTATLYKGDRITLVTPAQFGDGGASSTSEFSFLHNDGVREIGSAADATGTFRQVGNTLPAGEWRIRANAPVSTNLAGTGQVVVRRVKVRWTWRFMSVLALLAALAAAQWPKAKQASAAKAPKLDAAGRRHKAYVWARARRRHGR